MMSDASTFGSVAHQKNLLKKLGYDISQWNPKDKDEVQKLATILAEAQLSGCDSQGDFLSPEDLSLLKAMRGERG